MTEEKYTNILTDKQLELFIKICSLVDKINEGNSFRKLYMHYTDTDGGDHRVTVRNKKSGKETVVLVFQRRNDGFNMLLKPKPHDFIVKRYYPNIEESSDDVCLSKVIVNEKTELDKLKYLIEKATNLVNEM